MKRKKAIIYLFFAVILGLGIYGYFIEPYGIEIHHLRMNETVFGKTLKGITAVQISDLHTHGIGKRENKVLKIIDDINPDFIFLTGDYVEWYGDYEPAFEFLSRLKAGVGVWAVMGDYDYSNSRKSCLFCHEQGTSEPTRRHSVRFLRNSIEEVSLPTGDIVIKGMDEEDDTSLIGKGSAIVLSHSPLSFDEVNKDRDILMLSGDTHGGQVPLPTWLWKLVGYEKMAKYSHGFYREGRKMMYVSRGIGISHIPIRIFRRPEVVVLHF